MCHPRSALGIGTNDSIRRIKQWAVAGGAAALIEVQSHHEQPKQQQQLDMVVVSSSLQPSSHHDISVRSHLSRRRFGLRLRPWLH
jgi:hypothetical protein